MKKIILMNNTLTTGGITASMINAANELVNNYDVTIFCFIPEGSLKYRLSEKVHIIEPSWRFRAMCSTLGEAKKLGTKYYLYKIFARIWSSVFGNRFPIFIALSHQPNLGVYDLACSYTHEAGKNIEYTGLIRVLLYRINAPKKLSWVHCDYNNVPRTTYNNKYFNAVDAIVGVSDSVGQTFKKNNPKVHTPIETCYNMLNYNDIYILADHCENGISFSDSGIVCFSACRLSKIKGIVRMISCCHEIFKKNNVYWYIAGEGPEKGNIHNVIMKYGLSDRIILLGEQNNPFWYMKKADLYLSVSYEEAAPLVFFEAKALHTPIFATRTLSADELLSENVDYICDNDESSIKELFESATADKSVLAERKQKMNNFVGTNRSSLEFFQRWIES